MLVFTGANIAFLAVPKTASTAMEKVLGPHADVVFKRGRKHMTAQRFRTCVTPFLKNTWGIEPEVIAVMREPTDQIASWYRYRSRKALGSAVKSTRHMSFDTFVMATLKRRPPRVARIGTQYEFLSDARGQIAVHHLFSYEALPKALAFLEHRLDTALGALDVENASPPADTKMSSKVRAAFQTARVADFALYELLRSKGGYLGPAPLSAFSPPKPTPGAKLPSFLRPGARKIA